MNYKEESLGKIIVVGISIRTNNRIEAEERRITQLWEQFYSNNISSKINNKESEDVFCIYTQYDGDYTDDYTTIIGHPVSKVDDTLSKELISIKIEKANYYKFISEGEIPGSVLATWNHIWNSDYKRAYKADFDIYGTDCKDIMNAKVTTYLSIF